MKTINVRSHSETRYIFEKKHTLRGTLGSQIYLMHNLSTNPLKRATSDISNDKLKGCMFNRANELALNKNFCQNLIKILQLKFLLSSRYFKFIQVKKQEIDIKFETFLIILDKVFSSIQKQDKASKDVFHNTDKDDKYDKDCKVDKEDIYEKTDKDKDNDSLNHSNETDSLLKLIKILKDLLTTVIKLKMQDLMSISISQLLNDSQMSLKNFEYCDLNKADIFVSKILVISAYVFQVVSDIKLMKEPFVLISFVTLDKFNYNILSYLKKSYKIGSYNSNSSKIILQLIEKITLLKSEFYSLIYNNKVISVFNKADEKEYEDLMLLNKEVGDLHLKQGNAGVPKKILKIPKYHSDTKILNFKRGESEISQPELTNDLFNIHFINFDEVYSYTLFLFRSLTDILYSIEYTHDKIESGSINSSSGRLGSVHDEVILHDIFHEMSDRASIYKNFKKKQRKMNIFSNYGQINYVAKFKYDQFLKFYMACKSIYWRQEFIRNSSTKNEICRICEKSFALKEFVYHILFCLDSNIATKEIAENNNKLNQIYKKCKDIQRNYKNSYTRDMKKNINRYNNKKGKSTKGPNLDPDDLKLEDENYPLTKKRSEIGLKSVSNINEQKQKTTKPFIDNLLKIIKKEMKIEIKTYSRIEVKLLGTLKLGYLFSKILNVNRTHYNENKLNEILSLTVCYFLKKEFIINRMICKERLKNSRFDDVDVNKYTFLQPVFNQLFESVHSQKQPYDRNLHKHKTMTTQDSKSNTDVFDLDYKSFLKDKSPKKKTGDLLPRISLRRLLNSVERIKTFKDNKDKKLFESEDNLKDSPKLTGRGYVTPRKSLFHNDYFPTGSKTNKSLYTKKSIISSDSNLKDIDIVKDNSINVINYDEDNNDALQLETSFEKGCKKISSLKAKHFVEKIEKNTIFNFEEFNDNITLNDKAFNIDTKNILSKHNDSFVSNNSHSDEKSEGIVSLLESGSESGDTNSSHEKVDNIKDLDYLLKLYEEEEQFQKGLEFESPKKNDLDIMNIDIDDFQIIISLGSGGYGTVDLCKKKQTGDLYAIKSVDINKMKEKNLLSQLEKEKCILNEINHDNLVKCYYIFSDEKNYYFVMEFVQGGDTKKLFTNYKLVQDFNEIAKLFIAEIAIGLNYLHGMNIYHKDIKLENILISSTGHFKLADFGISEGKNLTNNFAITSNECAVPYNESSESSENDDDWDGKGEKDGKESGNESPFDEDGLITKKCQSLNPKNSILQHLTDKNRFARSETNQFLKNKIKKICKNFKKLFNEPQKKDKNILDKLNFDNINNNNNFNINNKNDNNTGSKVLGTANYLSPEIIIGTKTNGEGDYWALGVIVYYIFTKRLPFNADKVEDIFDNVLSNNIDWDLITHSNINKDLLKLVKGLLEPNISNRIVNITQIKNSPFYQGYDWENPQESSELKTFVRLNVKILNEKIKNMKKKTKDIKPLERNKIKRPSFFSYKIDNLDIANKSIVKKDLGDKNFLESLDD